MSKKSAIVIGAGIVGLAVARALSLKNYQVTVIERTEKPVGASIRNFGMIWPVGQPEGALYNRAMHTRSVWKDIAASVHLPYDESGSLHLAYYPDEWQVLQELYAAFAEANRPVSLMGKDAIAAKYDSVNTKNLLGGLYSDTELIIDPREAVALVAVYLKEFLDVRFIWGKLVTSTEPGKVYIDKETMAADLVLICSGADFETLYPEEYAALGMVKCKLQMMRFTADERFRLGTSLCGGLSLIHYKSFLASPSLAKLRERYETEMAEHLKWGIHVMVAQNNRGELTVGDSHEYGLTFEPFDQAVINGLIIDYLKQFVITDNWKLAQTWNGIYPKMTNGQTDVVIQPDPGVYIINGMGGAGMTLSFGFAEEAVAGL